MMQKYMYNSNPNENLYLNWIPDEAESGSLFGNSEESNPFKSNADILKVSISPTFYEQLFFV